MFQTAKVLLREKLGLTAGCHIGNEASPTDRGENPLQILALRLWEIWIK